MIALKVEDIRALTSKLFVGSVFDFFLLREATVVTFNTFSIDGHIKPGHYTEEELEAHQIEDLSSWSVIRPIFFSLIKGKKLPGSFHITLQLPPGEVRRLFKDQVLPIRVEQISGLYLNIRYEDAIMHCVTGTSIDLFTLDKSVERGWDEAVRQLFRNEQIACSEDD